MKEINVIQVELVLCPKLAVFILEQDALSVWTNLGKHLLLVGLFVSSIKTGTRRIIRLDQLSSVIRRSRRITKDSSLLVFILETNNYNQTNNECLPKFVQTGNAPSSIKTAIDVHSTRHFLARPSRRHKPSFSLHQPKVLQNNPCSNYSSQYQM